jgi:hypothetical protein
MARSTPGSMEVDNLLMQIRSLLHPVHMLNLTDIWSSDAPARYASSCDRLLSSTSLLMVVVVVVVRRKRVGIAWDRFSFISKLTRYSSYHLTRGSRNPKGCLLRY